MVFLEYYGNPFISCWLKERRTVVSRQIKTLHKQCNTLHGLRYYKQSYCKDNQIYKIFGPHEE